MSGFLASINRRPGLQRLILKSEEALSHYHVLPINALATVFDLATGLRKLEVGPIGLSGDAEDFAFLEQSIQNQSL